MTSEEAAQFAGETDLKDVPRLRSWDEMAKDASWEGPGLESYREMMLRHLTRSAPQPN